MNATIRHTVVLVGIAVTLAACGDSKPAAPGTQAPTAKPPAQAQAEGLLPPSELDTQLPPGVSEILLTPFTGDLDGMIKRRLVRIGVTFNRTFYFLDKGVQRGVAYEYAQLLEERLNAHEKIALDKKVYAVLVPLPRAMLLPALVQGKVDLVAAQLTITADRQKLVDFSNPTRMNVSEILVTTRGTPPIDSVDALSGREVFARDTSSYRQSLLMLNDRFKAEGKPPVVIRTAPENLEDDDLLEMVNAGLIPAIVVDDYLANFWKKVFPNLEVHDEVAVRTGGALAVAVRKNSPKLSAAVNTFMGNYGLGSAFGNTVERKYLINTTYTKSATAKADRERFLTLVRFFRKYSEQYNVDYLLMAAQGYQESQLNQNAKSAVGAIGVMQLMPATGREQNVGDIRQVESNIHAGVKYMHATADAFFKNEPMDDLNKGLFTFASYNAGPGRIRQLRRETEKRGLNPNVWFGNVEVVAADRIGRETVTYVSNIYKYYVAYRLVLEDADRKAAARAAVTAQDKK